MAVARKRGETMSDATKETKRGPLNFTNSNVKDLSPETALYTVWDGGGKNSVTGLGVRVTPKGAKSFVWKYTFNGKQRWLTIGSFQVWTVVAARDEVKKRAQTLGKGIDPASVIAEDKANPTMSDLFKRFVEDHLSKRKARTQADYEAIFKSYLQKPLGKLQVKDINSAHVAKIHAGMKDKPYRANRTLAVLSSMLSLAETWHYRDPNSNPCGVIERYEEKQLTRHLSSEELGRLLDTLLAQESRFPYHVRLVRLLLLTGARLREIMNCRWGINEGGEDLHPYLDLAGGRIVCVDHKGSRKQGPKDVLLSRAALEVVKSLEPLRHKSPYLFPSPEDIQKPLSNPHHVWGGLRENKRKRAKARPGLRDLAGLPGFRFHDLRHSFGALSVTLNQNPAVRQKLLGHASAATTERYSHADIDPLRAAVEQIGEAIAPSGGKLKKRSDLG